MRRATTGLLGRIEVIAGVLVVVLAFIAAGSFPWPVMAVGVTLLVTGHLMTGLAVAARQPPGTPPARSEHGGRWRGSPV